MTPTTSKSRLSVSCKMNTVLHRHAPMHQVPGVLCPDQPVQASKSWILLTQVLLSSARTAAAGRFVVTLLVVTI